MPVGHCAGEWLDAKLVITQRITLSSCLIPFVSDCQERLVLKTKLVVARLEAWDAIRVGVVLEAVILGGFHDSAILIHAVRVLGFREGSRHEGRQGKLLDLHFIN